MLHANGIVFAVCVYENEKEKSFDRFVDLSDAIVHCSIIIIVYEL